MTKQSQALFKTGTGRAKTPPAPKHLTADSRKLWDELQAEYSLADKAGQLLLTAALESRDRARTFAEELKGQPSVVADARGSVKMNPLVAAEREARAAFVRTLIALRIDVSKVN